MLSWIVESCLRSCRGILWLLKHQMQALDVDGKAHVELVAPPAAPAFDLFCLWRTQLIQEHKTHRGP
eukprot:2478447-Prorocentrum_lima.AAC.1